MNTERLMNWQTDELIDWWTDRLMNWQTDRLMNWQTEKPTNDKPTIDIICNVFTALTSNAETLYLSSLPSESILKSANLFCAQIVGCHFSFKSEKNIIINTILQFAIIFFFNRKKNCSMGNSAVYFQLELKKCDVIFFLKENNLYKL